MNKTVCFTGHRPNKLPGGYDYNSDKNKELSFVLENKILELLEKGYEHFICGGALGVDQIAFEVLCSLRDTGCNISIEIAIPFKNQTGNWMQSSKDLYNSQLTRADKLTFVDEIYNYNKNFEIGVYHPAKMEMRNRYMVDNSDIVIAVHDGTKGGTYNCISYAKKMNKEIILINEIFR